MRGSKPPERRHPCLQDAKASDGWEYQRALGSRGNGVAGWEPAVRKNRNAGTLACKTRKRLIDMANEENKTEKGRQLIRRGRYDRGYLPHYDSDLITQFVTFRLAGSLPSSVVSRLRRNLECGLISEIDYYREIDKYLDMSDGLTYLSEPQIADSIAETLLKFDRVKYELHSWVIMPNHGHILITPSDGYSLAEIMHSIKSFTANYANKILGRRGRFWSPEYFDRFIRNREHYTRAKKYIENNPVKAGLCREPEDWQWSSAWNSDRLTK